MPEKAIISIDAMGGDFGPEVTVPAAVLASKKHPRTHIILVGDEPAIRACAAKNNITLNKNIEIKHASEVVEMHDEPAFALRKKKDSSMRVAINLVHEGVAQAIISAGNTGALMATAKFVLKTIPGIIRPAISATIPSVTGHTQMLDLGANVDCTSEQLFQFAIMGSVLAEAIDNIESPRIGLLNIGSEATKGNSQVKSAHEHLVGAPINYIGYVEGDDIYNGTVDVVVCDGFVGNVSLKTSEGVAKMVSHFMKQEFSKGIYNKLAALIALPVLKALKKRIDPANYNGASMLGLNGIVIKSHGSANVAAYVNAIDTAIIEVKKSVPAEIRHCVEPLLAKQAV